MALQGTLDTFSLPDVLRLLATTGKTGRLRIEGDRGRGSVWLHEGKVVDAAADRAMDGTPPDEVAFELLRFESGSFAFDSDDRASDSASPLEVEDLLRKAHSLLSEWAELEAVVPSLAHKVMLSADLSADEVTIDADHWRTVVAVASGRTVGEMASALELTELGVSRAVRDLVELGVAEVGEPEIVPVPPRRQPVPDRTRRTASPVADTPTPLVPGPPAGGQRAGWMKADRTGEIPALAPEPGPGNGTGHPVTAYDDQPSRATPPPAPAPPPRLGRGRNAGAEGVDGGPAPTLRSGDGGRTGVPDAPRRPLAGPGDPPGPVGDTGRTPAIRPGDTGRTPAIRPGDAGRAPLPGRAAGPAGPAGPGGSGPAGRRDPGAPPRRSARPGGAQGRPGEPGPFDNGRGPARPLPHETGQVRPVSPSSLPPDLHWAADDVADTGPASSPFSGLSSLGPSGPPPPMNDGEVAAHVAAMSPEARAAVQSTVGNTGGISHGRGAGQGEDVAQRSRLISFLSSVR